MQNKKRDEAFYDTIIIGAGPAGCELAYQLAKRRFSVLVLEKEKQGRDKPCGGGIQLRELMEFGKLPLDVIERKIRKMRVISAQNKVLEAGMENKSLFAATVKRSVYDRSLQERAGEAGAKFLFRNMAEGIKSDGSSVSVYANGKELKTKLIVNAAGSSSQKINERLGIKEKCPELCITYNFLLKSEESHIDKNFKDAIELYFLKGRAQGYAWIFPKRDALSVGIGATAGCIKRGRMNIQELLRKFIKSHPIASKKLRGCRVISKSGGVINLGIMPRLYSKSFPAILIGDAGGFANIVHGGGIYHARKSALIASEYCAQFLRTGERKYLKGYDCAARKFFHDHELRWDRKIRNILWNEKTIDALVEKGSKDDRIKEALRIVLTSPESHEKAYIILEKKMLEMIYSELDKKTGFYKCMINRKLRTIFSKDGKSGPDLTEYANEALLNSKAKRLRALLGILSSEMFNGNRSNALNFSLVYEIFHTASLVHDDIIDDSEKRRGKKTLHERHGIGNAIVAGDLMLSKGYSLISKFSETSSISKKQVIGLLKIVGEAGERCCIGQSLDMSMAERKEYSSIEKYLRMIELKTGSLIEGSVKGGAVIAGASNKNVEMIGEFGKNLGIAFQIIDDSLDLLGGKAANKSVMNDLKQGKATPMLIYALQKAGKKDKKMILHAAGNRNLTGKEAEKIVGIYRKYDTIGYAQRLSHEYVSRARKELARLPKGKGKSRAMKPREQFNEILDVLDYWSMLGG
ncbi:MAG: geranylgeranyl reductase family protein [Candidatus Woesearchaeota archaeon]|nr:geranylgeranyl reductase family protein [Candidatus Woesearchaeota archaeon]